MDPLIAKLIRIALFFAGALTAAMVFMRYRNKKEEPVEWWDAQVIFIAVISGAVLAGLSRFIL